MKQKSSLADVDTTERRVSVLQAQVEKQCTIARVSRAYTACVLLDCSRLRIYTAGADRPHLVY